MQPGPQRPGAWPWALLYPRPATAAAALAAAGHRPVQQSLGASSTQLPVGRNLHAHRQPCLQAPLTAGSLLQQQVELAVRAPPYWTLPWLASCSRCGCEGRAGGPIHSTSGRGCSHVDGPSCRDERMRGFRRRCLRSSQGPLAWCMLYCRPRCARPPTAYTTCHSAKTCRERRGASLSWHPFARLGPDYPPKLSHSSHAITPRPRPRLHPPPSHPLARAGGRAAAGRRGGPGGQRH